MSDDKGRILFLIGGIFGQGINIFSHCQTVQFVSNRPDIHLFGNVFCRGIIINRLPGGVIMVLETICIDISEWIFLFVSVCAIPLVDVASVHRVIRNNFFIDEFL